MPTESLTAGGLQRYRRWLAVQRAKGREPSRAEMSSFLQAEVEAGVATSQKDRALSIEQQRTGILQERTDILREKFEDQQDAAKIAGVSELAKAAVSVNDLTGGAISKGVGKVVSGVSKAFKAPETVSSVTEAATDFSKFHAPSVYSAPAADTSFAVMGEEIWNSVFKVDTGVPTVLCTVLHEKGIMPDDIYAADVRYGNALTPDIIDGYHAWAEPLAALMQRHDIVLYAMAKPVMSWARHMAGRKNLFGYICEFVGVPICKLIGRLKILGELKWQTSYKA